MDMETPENPGTEVKYLAWDALGIGSCIEPPLPVSGFEVQNAAHGQIPAVHQLFWVSLRSGTKVCALCHRTLCVWPCLCQELGRLLGLGLYATLSSLSNKTTCK